MTHGAATIIHRISIDFDGASQIILYYIHNTGNSTSRRDLKPLSSRSFNEPHSEHNHQNPTTTAKPIMLYVATQPREFPRIRATDWAHSKRQNMRLGWVGYCARFLLVGSKVILAQKPPFDNEPWDLSNSSKLC